MFITIINDCKSENDIGRQSTRYSLLFPNTNITFVGISSNLGINSTLEAAGDLIDVLDASNGEEGIVCVNVAPRGQIKEDGENGSKFSYFWHKKTLIVSTIKGYNLSLIKKLGLASKINVLDTQEVLKFASDQGLIANDLKEYIAMSQFRSFDFQPRVARWLFDGIKLPAEVVSIDKVATVPLTPWLIDSFGNIKTTMLIDDILHRHPELVSGPEAILKQVQNDKIIIKTNYGEFKFYDRLKLVPNGETAIYIGSSGLTSNRFLEIATQNREGSAAKQLNLKIGDIIQIQ